MSDVDVSGRGVQLETAVASRISYAEIMSIEHVKAALMVLWVVTVAFVGYVGGTTSVTGWTMLGAVALTAPLITMRLWRVPAQSMSQSIQEVLRRSDSGVTRGGPR